MTKYQLEFYLNRENVFGFNTENDDKIVGWIKLFKVFPIHGFFERLVDITDSEIFQKQLKIKNEPYRVNIAQMSREIFDGDRFPGNENYLLNVTYFFSTLNDVEVFLKELGYDLSNLKWGVDFDFL